MSSHSRVDGERVAEVHGCVGDGAEDAAGHADGVVERVGRAPFLQDVFLGVVEIWLDGDAGVGFTGWERGWAEVDAAVCVRR